MGDYFQGHPFHFGVSDKQKVIIQVKEYLGRGHPRSLVPIHKNVAEDNRPGKNRGLVKKRGVGVLAKQNRVWIAPNTQSRLCLYLKLSGRRNMPPVVSIIR